MKTLTIIFCLLTIIMLIALTISIIKNDDNTSTNKEKRYTLLYIISFIFLMVSSIMSTLGNNMLSIILFVIFTVLLILATINYMTLRKALNSKNKSLVPKKLKNNLKIVKENRDGYTYKINVLLNCCDTNDFKVEQIKTKDLHIVNCICNKCNNKYEIYNSELDGYNLENNNDIRIIKEKFTDNNCSKCKKNSYKVEINYEYLDDLEEIKEQKILGISDLSNLYTSIKVNLICNKCNKKEKDYINHEFK